MAALGRAGQPVARFDLADRVAARPGVFPDGVGDRGRRQRSSASTCSTSPMWRPAKLRTRALTDVTPPPPAPCRRRWRTQPRMAWRSSARPPVTSGSMPRSAPHPRPAWRGRLSRPARLMGSSGTAIIAPPCNRMRMAVREIACGWQPVAASAPVPAPPPARHTRAGRTAACS